MIFCGTIIEDWIEKWKLGWFIANVFTLNAIMVNEIMVTKVCKVYYMWKNFTTSTNYYSTKASLVNNL
jgi:hypothetical protein